MTLSIARRLFGAMSLGIALEVGRRFGSKAGMSVLFILVLIVLVIIGLSFPDAFGNSSTDNPVAAQTFPVAGTPVGSLPSMPADVGAAMTPVPLQNAAGFPELDASQVLPIRWTPRCGASALPRRQQPGSFANVPPASLGTSPATLTAMTPPSAGTSPLTSEGTTPPSVGIPPTPEQQTSPAAGGAAPDLPPFQEAHWQGVELIPSTPALVKLLKVPSGVQGVIADDVTLPADVQGFQAGDVFMSVGGIPTPDLECFIAASEQVRDQSRVEIQIWRKGTSQTMVLAALKQRLGTANGETAPMIKPGSRPPHGYNGPCTQCHRIGSTGQLPVDQGDLLTRKAPPIRLGQIAPHRVRGECTACHKIIQ